MLMRAHNGAVDEHLFEIGIRGQMSEDNMPQAIARPPCEALIAAVPLPEFGWQISPGAPVRAIYNTASTNSRLSAAVRPGSLALPSNRASIRSN